MSQKLKILMFVIAITLTSSDLIFAGNPVFSTKAYQALVRGNVSAVGFLIDGGGSAITTGIKGDIEIPFDCTIERVTLLADQSGSIKVDIWADGYSGYPPTNADSITGTAEPTISADIKSQDETLTGWTKNLSAGDTIRINVDSASTMTRCLLSLILEK